MSKPQFDETLQSMLTTLRGMDDAERFFTRGQGGGCAILAAVADARRKIGYIAKTQENEHFKFNFRGIDDALNVIGPALLECGITPVPEFGEYKFDIVNVTKSNGNQVSVSVASVRLDLHLISNKDGSSIRIRTYGESRDTSDDKATAKAESAAFKIAAFLGLMVPAAPDMLDDPDKNKNEGEDASAGRASSALKPEDSGAARSELFNKASNLIKKAGQSGDMALLKKHAAGIDKTAQFSAEEKAALHRLVSNYINEITANARNKGNS